MNFCSHYFILIYLPLFLVLYNLAYKIKGIKASKLVLLFFSFIFYIYASIPAFAIFLAECGVTYFLAWKSKEKNSKALLVILIVFQVMILGIFKYSNFFIDTFNAVFPTSVSTLNLLLPLGISFFTFQQVAYSVDIYKGDIQESSLLDYLCFSFLFITISSGPIIYYNELIPQLNENECHKVNYENMYKGLILLMIGMCKKVLVANVFAQAVSVGYDNIFSYSSTSVLLLVLSYTLQLYFDFSGYCDMGLGISKMMNIKLPINFSSPYKAFTIAEFWDRWHITLTRFFTKYVYIPLGGSRKGKIRTYINIFIVFFVSGLWHGADYKFIIWGMLHGMMMIGYRMFKKTIDKWHPAFNWFVTFSFINVAWVYFGAPTIALANTAIVKLIKYQPGEIHKTLAQSFLLKEVEFIASILNVDVLNSLPYVMMLLYLVIALYVILCCRNSYEYVESGEVKLPVAISLAVLSFLAICSMTGSITFVYQYF